jgi:UDPglucose 6-dehydrogenase
MKVSVIGTGYVGLVSGVCLAAKGPRGHLRRSRRGARSRASTRAIRRSTRRGSRSCSEERRPSLRATTDLPQAVLGSDISLIAVGTPFDGSAIDLKYIRAVAAEIGAVLTRTGPATTSSW